MTVKYLWQYDDELSAYHEAGHTTIANLLGCKVEKVTLTEAIVWQLEDDHLTTGRIALGGPLAECRKRGVSIQEFHYADVDRWTHEAIIALQEFALCGADYEQEVQWVNNALLEHWATVEVIARNIVR